MMSEVIIMVKRSGKTTEDVKKTLSVKELRRVLEDISGDTPVYFRFGKNGHYAGITEEDITLRWIVD